MDSREYLTQNNSKFLVNGKIPDDSEYEISTIKISRMEMQAFCDLYKNSQKRLQESSLTTALDGLFTYEKKITMVIDCSTNWKSKKPYFLKLHNCSDKNIVYQVKVTNTSRYYLQNEIGVIAPNSKKNAILCALIEKGIDLKSIDDRIAIFWKKTDIEARELNEQQIKKILKQPDVHKNKLTIEIENYKNCKETEFYSCNREARQNIMGSICQSQLTSKNSSAKNSPETSTKNSPETKNLNVNSYVKSIRSSPERKPAKISYEQKSP